MNEETRVKMQEILNRLKELLAARDAVALEEYSIEQHPADLAEAYSLLDEHEKHDLIDLLSNELTADIVQEMDPDEQAELVGGHGLSQGHRHNRGNGIRRCDRPSS
jgi:Mg/Co/Ni transporter MgtE